MTQNDLAPLEDDDQLEPLGVSCTATDCENGLHCFLQKKRRARGMPRHGGPCRTCGVSLIEWSRVNRRSLADADYTFRALKNEYIRHHFWHTVFSDREMRHALRKGRALLRQAAFRRLQVSVGRANHPAEGRQTPFSGTVILHAQHAVAACCRKCIEYWHGIPAGEALDQGELAYLHELVMLYIAARLPDLPDGPTKVPRHAQRMGTTSGH